MTRLEEFLSQRQENVTKQKSILKAAHEDLAQLQKSLQTAQDLAKIFQELEQAKERYRLEIEEGAQGQAEAKSASGGITVCSRSAGNHSDLECSIGNS